MVALFTISNLLHFTRRRLDDRPPRALRHACCAIRWSWSTFVGFAFALTHPPMPEWASIAIKMVGDALIPMMLLSLGVRLTDVRWTTGASASSAASSAR